MAKGDDTRQAILERAFELAKVVGVTGLSIGRLAEATGLSKSGLFAHFGSKEALEVAVVQEATRQFVEAVMLPALKQPRGEPRVRAMFERWLAWDQRPGGCFFITAIAELDDRVGPQRDAMVQTTKDWIDAIATAARIGIAEGHFRSDLDTAQFAFDLYNIGAGTHTFQRFLRDPDWETRAHRSLDRLLDSARPPADVARGARRDAREPLARGTHPDLSSVPRAVAPSPNVSTSRTASPSSTAPHSRSDAPRARRDTRR